MQLQQARQGTSPSQGEGANQSCGVAEAADGEEEGQEISSSAGDGDDEVSLPALHSPLLHLLLVCQQVIQVITALPETAETALWRETLRLAL